jgi:hypothetical protein
MIYCVSPSLECWVAPPQEDLPRPTWTKLIADGILLSNSLEYANWRVNPVEPFVCDSCWNSGCVQTGLARIVRLADDLLWLPPRPCDIDSSRRAWLSEANFIRHAVLMPAATWERLRQTCPNLPSANSYAPATRADLAALWIHEMPEGIRVHDVGQLEKCLRAVLASDPLDLDSAREAVRLLVGWLLEAPEEAVHGRLVRAQTFGVAINTFYFDGDEWPSFAVGWERGFAFGADLHFAAEPTP